MWVPKFCCIVFLVGVSSENLTKDNFTYITLPVNFENALGEFLEKNNTKTSLKCLNALRIYQRNLKQGSLWAWRMLDATPKMLPSGMLEGNLVDLGSFDECLKVEGETSKTQVNGKYCIGTVTMKAVINRILNRPELQRQLIRIYSQEEKTLSRNNEEVGLHLATCLPDSCSATDIEGFYASFLGPDLLIFKPELCQTKNTKPELGDASIAALAFLGVVLGIMIASTTYDVIIYYMDTKPAHPLLIAFSVLTNTRKIMWTNNSPNQISCLHGIRVISTMWVVIGHRYQIQSMFPVRNSLFLISWARNRSSMFILSATLSVDTFFLISGLVLSYMYLITKSKGIKFNIFLFYLYRYLRLTPALAVVILINATLQKHLGSGPLWPNPTQEIQIRACEDFWWKSLLYIQNFNDDVQKICIAQSWYLAVDTQLYLLSPILLIPLGIWPKKTVLATGCLTLCSVLASFLTGWFFRTGFNLSVGVIEGVDNLLNYFKYYYFATWTRAASWLLGLILGYFIFTIKHRKVRFTINKGVCLVLWVTSLAILCACVFTGQDMYIGKYRRLDNAFFMALERPSWAIAVGWIIFACAAGYGGPVNWFLSLPAFQVVSKLSYTIYLVHVTVVFMMTAQVRSAPIVSNVNLMYAFWGDFAFSAAVALVMTLAFESPVVTITGFLVGGRLKDKKTKTAESIGNEENNDPGPENSIKAVA